MTPEETQAAIKTVLEKLNTPGTATSEHAANQSTSKIAWAMIILGCVGTIAGPLADQLAGTKIGQWAGIVAAVAGLLTKLLSDSAYTQSRTEVKTSAADLAAELAKLQAPPKP